MWITLKRAKYALYLVVIGAAGILSTQAARADTCYGTCNVCSNSPTCSSPAGNCSWRYPGECTWKGSYAFCNGVIQLCTCTPCG